jgi:hypothetical protein
MTCPLSSIKLKRVFRELIHQLLTEHLSPVGEWLAHFEGVLHINLTPIDRLNMGNTSVF